MHKDKFSFSFPCKQAVIFVKVAGGYRSYSSFSYFSRPIFKQAVIFDYALRMCLGFLAFGSVTTSRFSDKSDIDLLIDFEPSISIDDYTDNFFFLREKFTALFNRDVDLVTRRSLSNPFFIEDVEQSKVLIYG